MKSVNTDQISSAAVQDQLAIIVKELTNSIPDTDENQRILLLLNSSRYFYQIFDKSKLSSTWRISHSVFKFNDSDFFFYFFLWLNTASP